MTPLFSAAPWRGPRLVLAGSAGLAGTSTEERYLSFTRPAADVIRRRGVPHVVGVSSAGHDWPTRAGMLSAAFAMDAEIERTGTAYRALSMPFYMENLLAQLGVIREQGTFSLAYAADRPLAIVATRDIAVNAAALLAERSWTGQEHVPVFGPDRISPNAMAALMSEVLGRTVTFRQMGIADVKSALTQRGASEGVVGHDRDDCRGERWHLRRRPGARDSRPNRLPYLVPRGPAARRG